ncbi:MAG: T9SS type A sorting domain-containing protein, partial [Bacteroidota bacterium]
HSDQMPVIVTSYLRTDFNSDVIPGAVRGNNISFRIWDSSANKEYNASAVFQRGGHFADMPSSIVSSLKADIIYPLYISEVTDPFDQFSARYVELYNSGSTAVNFDDEIWYLSRQANGGTTWNEIRLTKSILPGETYLIAVDTANFHKYYGFTADIGIAGSAGNGDDAYYLYKNGGRTTGLLVDIYGEANTDGTGKAWEYTDSRSVRKHDIVAASAVWNPSEWKRYFPSKLNYADMTPGEHPETEETKLVASAGQYSFDKEPTGLEIVVKSITGSDSVTVKHQRGQITDNGPGVPEDYAVSSYRWFIEKRSGITGIITELRFLHGRLADAGIEEGATDIYLYKRSVKNTGNYLLVCPLLYFDNGTKGNQSDDYVYCDNISEFSEFVIVSPSQALPVELTAFSAIQTGRNVLLNWQTQTELDNYGYEIERKSTQSDWTKIAFIKGNGTTNKVSNYSYTDNIGGQSGWVSYRLKQIDLSGNYKYYTENRVMLNSPSGYVLEQNYPNPFNPETNISFSIPADQNVRIVIYNQLGELVDRLLDENIKAGYHKVTWRPEGLATGIYYVRLTAGDYISVRKILYLK